MARLEESVPGHTILVTDLDYATRASSSKKITTMQYGIRTEMAFENCCVFQVQGERHQDILDTLDRVVVFLEEHGQDQGDGTTVHICLCLHCMFPNGSTLRLTEATFKEFSRKLAEMVHSIGQLLTTPVLRETSSQIQSSSGQQDMITVTLSPTL